MMEEYDGDDLFAVLEAISFVDEVSVDDLLEMGWYQSGEVMVFRELS
tara:strand:- start:287 stop:427 length:141 start_codon:yes stop_codon:yes gene_type:complete